MKIILEMANNHMGSVDHGKLIIRSFKEVIDEVGLNAKYFIKFQYRDLDSYINDDVKGDMDIHFVKRFESTRLSKKEFSDLREYAIKLGYGVACTPFDSVSAKRVIDEGFDILKIASACIDDWDIHEAVVSSIASSSSAPEIVFSTGGASVDQVDRLASFYNHRIDSELSILHCIAAYPYKNEDANLSMIPALKGRYPYADIGYSAHEYPDVVHVGAMAYCLGASVFEKHVGVDTNEYSNNQYTIQPGMFKLWLSRLKEAEKVYENPESDSKIESDTVYSLKRGAVLKKDVIRGEMIARDDVRFTFPRIKEQLGPENFGLFSSGFLASKAMLAGERMLYSEFDSADDDEGGGKYDEQIIAEYVHKTKGLIRESGISYKINVNDVELSHHYGIGKLNEFGALLVTRINTEYYSKKIVIQIPGQKHPTHKHHQKDETFEVLYGSVVVKIGDDEPKKLISGDIIRIRCGEEHSFETDEGVVFEEVATQALPNDSEYKDMIDANRKSGLSSYWDTF